MAARLRGAKTVDLVVFGATGDTGISAVKMLYHHGKDLGITSWAPAARYIGFG
jgi:hypothetical protein